MHPPVGFPPTGDQLADPSFQIYFPSATIQFVVALDDPHRSVERGDAAVEIISTSIGADILVRSHQVNLTLRFESL